MEMQVTFLLDEVLSDVLTTVMTHTYIEGFLSQKQTRAREVLIKD